MVTNQRLSDRLSSVMQMGPEDINWYHFILDHKEYLRRKSTYKEYTPEQLVKYRYRPNEFYTEECKGEAYMAWIFLLVNEIRDPSEFNENNTRLYIPQATDITTLYSTYSVSVNQKDFSDL